MWTDPHHVAQWWGPHGFTNPVCEMDVRPGGALRIVMRAPDGTDYPMTETFREIAAPERLVAMVAAATRMLDGMEAGWTQSIDRLAAHVAQAKS
jgi:uncharacterized protein YndB with AHSA1/START domain